MITRLAMFICVIITHEKCQQRCVKFSHIKFRFSHKYEFFTFSMWHETHVIFFMIFFPFWHFSFRMEIVWCSFHAFIAPIYTPLSTSVNINKTMEWSNIYIKYAVSLLIFLLISHKHDTRDTKKYTRTLSMDTLYIWK